MSADKSGDDMWRIANYGSDLEWFEVTGGSCGGCGEDSCHPDTPCGNVCGYDHGVCNLCATRVDTGEVRSVDYDNARRALADKAGDR